jgi:hypothetical protein
LSVIDRAAAPVGTGRGDETPLAEDEPLDELSVGGKYTSVRINWEGRGEAEPPGMWPDGWTSFFSGADRFSRPAECGDLLMILSLSLTMTADFVRSCKGVLCYHAM